MTKKKETTTTKDQQCVDKHKVSALQCVTFIKIKHERQTTPANSCRIKTKTKAPCVII